MLIEKVWITYELAWRKTLGWYWDAWLTLHYAEFAYFTHKLQLSEWDQNQLYKYNQHQNKHNVLLNKIAINIYWFKSFSVKLFSICMHVYKIQPQQKEATRITISFVNNKQSILSQSSIIKTRNPFQYKGDLINFPFKILLTFFTFPFQMRLTFFTMFW